MIRRALPPTIAVVALAAALYACGSGGGPDAAEPRPQPGGVEVSLEFRQGGMGSTIDDSAEAFSLSSRNVNHYERQLFADGKDVFEAAWSPGEPSGDDAEETFVGLGPTYDAVSCASCHVDDGRGPGPARDGALPEGMVVRLTTDDAAAQAHYGAQLQRATTAGTPEAEVTVRFETVDGTYDDGTPYELRRPVYEVRIPDRAPDIPDDAVLTVVVPPQLVGLGLLEHVPVDDLHRLADPTDADGDGISGRLGEAWDPWSGITTVGRFGWQAGAASVEQQTATAAFHDLGLTSRWFPTTDCDTDRHCYRAGGPITAAYYEPSDGAYSGGAVTDQAHDLSDDRLFELTMYSQLLAVPAVRDTDDPEVEWGASLFGQIGCASCHVDGLTTGYTPVWGLSNQVIHPRSDLLVHDLGDGLADRTLAGVAVETEWRTPPLWGIGLVETVNGHTFFLHDGRARDLEEAVLWHGGEAQAAADAFRALDADDRAALLRYLESL